MKKIGVFDSGIGGLTVLRALKERAPEADYVFLGDLARVPYGTHTQEEILEFARSDAAFLRSQGAECIIIACNTATAYSLKELREELDVPVWGVIAPAAEEAIRVSRRGVAVIATEATVRSGSYERALRELRPGGEFYFQACPRLVTMIEGGVGEEEEAALAQCREYLTPLMDKDIDTLVLGCTHFPMYAHTISRLLPGVQLVDTGAALSAAMADVLDGARGSGVTDYCVTAPSQAFQRAVCMLDPGAESGCVRCIGAL